MNENRATGEITSVLHAWRGGQPRRLAGAFMRREATLQAWSMKSTSARLMRMILRDWARNRKIANRGEGTRLMPLSDVLAWIDAGEDIVHLDRALSELEQLDERKVRLLEFRAFLAGVSKATADRELQLAKAWLNRRLGGAPPQ